MDSFHKIPCTTWRRSRTGRPIRGWASNGSITAQSAHDDAPRTDQRAEKAVAKRSGWVEFGATAGLAAGVAFLPATAAVGTAAMLIPLATDTASGAAEQVIGQMVGDFSDNSVDEHKEKLTREEKTKIYSGGESMAEAPMGEFLDRHGVGKDSVFGQDLRESMLIGYGVGNDRENQQGNDPETG